MKAGCYVRLAGERMVTEPSLFIAGITCSPYPATFVHPLNREHRIHLQVTGYKLLQIPTRRLNKIAHETHKVTRPDISSIRLHVSFSTIKFLAQKSFLSYSTHSLPPCLSSAVYIISPRQHSPQTSLLNNGLPRTFTLLWSLLVQPSTSQLS